jgi:hypothetical protein
MMVGAHALMGGPDRYGRVGFTLVVTDAAQSAQSYRLGPYRSRSEAQSAADITVDVLTRRAKVHGFFTSDEIHRAIQSAEHAARRYVDLR